MLSKEKTKGEDGLNYENQDLFQYQGQEIQKQNADIKEELLFFHAKEIRTNYRNKQIPL